MNNVTCENCEFLKLHIGKQQSEIIRLRTIIAEARGIAYDIEIKADEIMSTHQPRGKWAFARGARQSALTIARRLEVQR